MDDSNYDQSRELFDFSKKEKVNNLLKKLILERLKQDLKGKQSGHDKIIESVKADVGELQTIEGLHAFSQKIHKDKDDYFTDFEQLFKATNGLKDFKREKQGFFSTSTKKLEENKNFGDIIDPSVVASDDEENELSLIEDIQADAATGPPDAAASENVQEPEQVGGSKRTHKKIRRRKRTNGKVRRTNRKRTNQKVRRTNGKVRRRTNKKVRRTNKKKSKRR